MLGGRGEKVSSNAKEELCRDGTALSRSCSITGTLMRDSIMAHIAGNS